MTTKTAAADTLNLTVLRDAARVQLSAFLGVLERNTALRGDGSRGIISRKTGGGYDPNPIEDLAGAAGAARAQLEEAQAVLRRGLVPAEGWAEAEVPTGPALRFADDPHGERAALLETIERVLEVFRPTGPRTPAPRWMHGEEFPAWKLEVLREAAEELEGGEAERERPGDSQALDVIGERIVACLARHYPRRMTATKLCDETQKSEQAVRGRLRSMHRAGTVDWPEGTRRGAGLTEQGLKIARAIEARDRPVVEGKATKRTPGGF